MCHVYDQTDHHSIFRFWIHTRTYICFSHTNDDHNVEYMIDNKHALPYSAIHIYMIINNNTKLIKESSSDLQAKIRSIIHS